MSIKNNYNHLSCHVMFMFSICLLTLRCVHYILYSWLLESIHLYIPILSPNPRQAQCRSWWWLNLTGTRHILKLLTSMSSDMKVFTAFCANGEFHRQTQCRSWWRLNLTGTRHFLKLLTNMSPGHEGVHRLLCWHMISGYQKFKNYRVRFVYLNAKT